jgi:hypothetical protein
MTVDNSPAVNFLQKRESASCFQDEIYAELLRQHETKKKVITC